MRPTIGRIVIYRGADGVDSPAIVTALETSGETGVVRPHLHVFWAPGARSTFEYERGIDQAAPQGDVAPGTWRWPERVG